LSGSGINYVTRTVYGRTHGLTMAFISFVISMWSLWLVT